MSKPIRRPVYFTLVALIALLLSSLTVAAPGSRAAADRSAPMRQSVQQTPPAPATRQGASPSRVRSSGKLIVGTSADYPPFAYYDKNFRLDGFDVVLIREIAKRMGLTVEIKDYAFDGLLGALQLGQIDAAIGAISLTPEREQLADFTSAYYVSEDAVLTLPNSPAGAFTSERDLARWRVGVQRGSVYEQWLKKTLVDTGLMPGTNLYAYPDIKKASADLKANRIDAIMLDLEPAKALAAANGLAIAGQGLNRQVYAIAVQAGDEWLHDSFNAVIEQLQTDGFIAGQVERFIGLDSEETLPPPTPTPTPCIDGMSFVLDLTYDDTRAVPVVSPGQPLHKGWRLRNAGACPWTPAYTLTYAGGNLPAAQPSGQVVSVPSTVPPGATVDLYADLMASTTPGAYRAYWQMVNSQGKAFGERIWVTVQVPSPTPTPAPVPVILFGVDRTNIQQGECVNFSWNTQNISAVYFYREGENWQDNPAVGQEVRIVCPPNTSTHTLRVVLGDGTVDTRLITIYVSTPQPAPRITRFTIVPEGRLTLGQCVTITWDVSGNPTQVILKRQNTVLQGNSRSGGSLQDCPPLGSMVYELTASGPGGLNRAQKAITVVQRPTPAPPPPRIDFKVDRTNVRPGDCVDFSWNVQGAKNVYFWRSGEKPREHPVGGRGDRSVCPLRTGRYYLMAEWPKQASETREILINVVGK